MKLITAESFLDESWVFRIFYKILQTKGIILSSEVGNLENMAIWANSSLPSVAHTQYATGFCLRRLGEMFCSVSFLSLPPPLIFKISHPRLQTLKMLGATLIQSKDQEDCSLRKASNRLLLRCTLRNFFCPKLHPSVCSISLESAQNQDHEKKIVLSTETW